jgi:hypothetical protein
MERRRGQNEGFCEKKFLIRYFASYFSWCNSPSCQMRIGGQKGGGLHHLRTEVIL